MYLLLNAILTIQYCNYSSTIDLKQKTSNQSCDFHLDWQIFQTIFKSESIINLGSSRITKKPLNLQLCTNLDFWCYLQRRLLKIKITFLNNLNNEVNLDFQPSKSQRDGSLVLGATFFRVSYHSSNKNSSSKILL